MASAVLLAVLLVGGTYSLELTVDTTSGLLQGVSQFGTVHFLGIPYAEPPVGDRRFRKPVMKSRMSGSYNASYYRPRCPQLSDKPNMDEDCLYLNIYAPPSASGANPKPVMVWIHGGSYLYGSGEEHDGTLLVLYQDVIVVNLNYRLGALGFLNTRDGRAEGNLGLWDMTMALRWVKRNIAAFGGDPNAVTIFGESAGSGSVTQLSMSPLTEGLFGRAIAESGSGFARWSHYEDPVGAARRLGQALNCSATSSIAALVACLRQRPASDVVKAQHAVQPVYAFSPTYHTEFLPHTPQELTTTHVLSLAARRCAELDFIVGLNVDEGGFYYTGFLATLPIEQPFTDEGGVTEEVFDYAIQQSVTTIAQGDARLAEKLKPPLKFMFTNWQDRHDSIARTKELVKFLADTSFLVPATQFARLHAKLKAAWNMAAAKGTYMYLFKHRGSWMPTAPWRSGADHADEIPFVFGHPLSGLIPMVTGDEKALSTAMMTYWGNFARTGNPNQPPGSLPTYWPQYQLSSEHHIELDVGMTNGSVGSHVFNDRVAFWLELFPKQLEIFTIDPKPCPYPGEM